MPSARVKKMNLVDIIRLKGCDYYLRHVKLKVAVLSSFRRVRYVIFGKPVF